MSNKNNHIKTQSEIRKDEVRRFMEYAQRFHQWYWRDKKNEDMKTTKDFINEGNNEFIDIDSETKRTYHFKDHVTVIIENPLKLCVKENGHRVWDAQNVSHYIPSGWHHLTWEVKEGKPNFVK